MTKHLKEKLTNSTAKLYDSLQLMNADILPATVARLCRGQKVIAHITIPASTYQLGILSKTQKRHVVAVIVFREGTLPLLLSRSKKNMARASSKSLKPRKGKSSNSTTKLSSKKGNPN